MAVQNEKVSRNMPINSDK